MRTKLQAPVLKRALEAAKKDDSRGILKRIVPENRVSRLLQL